MAAPMPAEAFAGTLTDLYMPIYAEEELGRTPIGLPVIPW